MNNNEFKIIYHFLVLTKQFFLTNTNHGLNGSHLLQKLVCKDLIHHFSQSITSVSEACELAHYRYTECASTEP